MTLLLKPILTHLHYLYEPSSKVLEDGSPNISELTEYDITGSIFRATVLILNNTSHISSFSPEYYSCPKSLTEHK